MKTKPLTVEQRDWIKNRLKSETKQKEIFNNISKFAERTENLANGVVVQLEIKVPLDVTIIWDEGEDCTARYPEVVSVDSDQVEKSIKEIKNKINKEIKEICKFVEKIGVNPDDLKSLVE